MAIDDKTIAKVAELAMLNIAEADKERLKNDLEKIRQMMDKLQEADTTGYDACSQINVHPQQLRKDVVTADLSREAALSNAKQKSDSYFLVPKVIKK